MLEEVIAPACSQLGLTPVRADGLTRAGEINEQVCRRLRDDDIVIADLTGANANVMYELGLRHTRSKLTVQIGEYGRLPFDINMIRTIQFSRSAVGPINARDDLIEVLETGIAGDYDPVTATRVWNHAPPEDAPAATTEATSEGAGDKAAGDDERGFIDVLAEAEQQQPVLLAAINELSACTEDLGHLADESTEEVRRSDAANKGARGRLQVATKHAQGLSAIAERLDLAVNQYEAALKDVSAGTLLLIKRMSEDAGELKQGQQFGMIARRMAQTTRAGMESSAGLAASIEDNARMSRVMKEPSKRIVGALGRMVRATAVVDEWDRQLQSLGVPVPPEDWEPDFGDQPAGDGDS